MPKTTKDKSADKVLKLIKVKNYRSKKINSKSKLPNINTVDCGPSTSTGRVFQEPKSQHHTKEVTNTDLNSKFEDVEEVDVEKHHGKIQRSDTFWVDGFNEIKYDNMNNEIDRPINSVFEIPIDNELHRIQQSKLRNENIQAIGSVLKKNSPNNELEALKQNTQILRSPEHNWSAELKDVPPINSKFSAASHNKNSASKNVPKLSSCHVPVGTKQATLSKSSSKIQQPINSIASVVPPAAHSKHPITPVVTQSTPSKRTATQFPSGTKQLISLPPSGKPTVVCQSTLQEHSTVSVTQLPPQGGKPTIVCQSSLQGEKKCSKCKLLSVDDFCISCRLNLQLKDVTVTLVGTTGTQLNDNDPVQCIFDDKEDNENIEPIVRKTETPEELTRHIEKLNLNPKFLEDMLWQKNLGFQDYFKFERCHSVRIGNFNTSPVSSGDMVICKHGIRMTINNSDLQPVTIDIHIDNIVKILGFYGETTPSLFVYTNYLAAHGIRHLLNMSKDQKNNYFNPISKDHTRTKIIWYFDLEKNEESQLKRLLLKLPKGKYEPLTMEQAKTIELKSNKKSAYTSHVNCEELNLTNHIIGDKYLPAIKISDYKCLAINQYVNDILIEFYLNYAYCHKLSVKDQERTFVFDTFLYTSLTRPRSLSRITKKVNIFEKDFIVVPINENKHWFMAVICFPYLTCPVYMDDGKQVPKEEWDHLDQPSSLNCDISKKHIESYSHGEDTKNFKNVNVLSVDYETYLQNLSKIKCRPIKQPCILIFDSLCLGKLRTKNVARLRKWLCEEYSRKYNGAERKFTPNVMKGALIKVPQQNNLTDCGLFVMHYFEKFFERPILDYRFPIKHLGNWFNPDEVSLKCQKRREVQRVILNLMKEQGIVLPKVYCLPTLSFGLNELPIPTNCQPTYDNTKFQPGGQSREIHNDQDEDKEHLENYTTNHDSDRHNLMENHVPECHNYMEDHDPDQHNHMVDDDDPDHLNCMEDHNAEHLNYMEEVNEGNNIDQYNQYSDEYAELSDQRDCYGEMGENVDWPMDTQDEFPELDCDEDRGVNQYQNFTVDNENEVDSTRTSIRRNRQNVSIESLRVLRSNNPTCRSHVQEICEDEDSEDESDAKDNDDDKEFKDQFDLNGSC